MAVLWIKMEVEDENKIEAEHPSQSKEVLGEYITEAEEGETYLCSPSSIPKPEMEKEVSVRTCKLPMCEDCGKAFSSSEDFRQHLTRHECSHAQKCPTITRIVSGDEIVIMQRDQLPSHEADDETISTGPVEYPTAVNIKVEPPSLGDLQTQAINLDNYYSNCIGNDDALDTGDQDVANAEKSVTSEAFTQTASVPGKLRPLAKVVSMCDRTNTSVECNSWSHGNVPSTFDEECRICGGRFVNLARHMRLHEGRKTNKCEQRFEYFPTKWDTKKHVRVVHRGEVRCGKPIYKCEMCPKTFEKKWDLNVHRKLHSQKNFAKSNVKRNRCSSCYPRDLDCEAHRKVQIIKPGYKHALKKSNVHNDEPIQFSKHCVCNICRKSCGTRYRNNKHMLVHARDGRAKSYNSRVFKGPTLSKAYLAQQAPSHKECPQHQMYSGDASLKQFQPQPPPDHQQQKGKCAAHFQGPATDSRVRIKPSWDNAGDRGKESGERKRRAGGEDDNRGQRGDLEEEEEETRDQEEERVEREENMCVREEVIEIEEGEYSDEREREEQEERDEGEEQGERGEGEMLESDDELLSVLSDPTLGSRSHSERASCHGCCGRIETSINRLTTAVEGMTSLLEKLVNRNLKNDKPRNWENHKPRNLDDDKPVSEPEQTSECDSESEESENDGTSKSPRKSGSGIRMSNGELLGWRAGIPLSEGVLLSLQANATSRKNFAKKLMSELVSDDILSESNCNGRGSKISKRPMVKRIDQQILSYVMQTTLERYNVPSREKTMCMQECRNAINLYCRSLFYKKNK
ncbi:uncharacterized protein [Diadema antillarum]|uniref:uncharacterized protein isoform X1 n=1 Tax=Diadema antillarum TaxID=105358 RepID=UPI003A838323